MCAGLVLTHGISAVLYASTAKLPLLQALFGSRGLRMRVTAGGQYRPLVDDGQGWRLIRSVFLHADGLHLLLNVSALWVIGRLLEPWVGGIRMTWWFLLAGVGGSIASHQMGLLQSDGASGGAFGLFGAVLVLAWRNRNRLDPRDRPILMRALPALLVANLALSLVLPFVDGIAHLGGLIVGLVVVLVTSPRRPSAVITALEAVGIAGLLAIAAFRISFE